MTNKSSQKATREKPISLHPLSLKEALGALLAMKPPPERKKRDKEEGQTKKPGSK